jgi:hypothetical protein
MQTLKNTIIELMNVPEEQSDLNWLRKSLQAAIKLEFSTIPPYLCALWSIDSRTPEQRANNGPPVPPTGDVANALRRQIAREEMLHFAIACNLLGSTGGVPALNIPDALPSYPGPLAGLDNPDLIIYLQGLTPAALFSFLQVEYPEFMPVTPVGTRPVSTIGEFYTRILKAFQAVTGSGELTFNKDRQIDMQNTSFFDRSYVVENISDVENAIKTIQRQGEGSAGSPEDSISENDKVLIGSAPVDLAHYYRFAEIFEGRKLIKTDQNKYDFLGNPIPFPIVYPMAKVPAGGYQKDQVPPNVWDEIVKFDQIFSQMMKQLQTTWTPDPITGKVDPTASELNNSIGTMRNLIKPAQNLISTRIVPDGSRGNYGPCFRIVALD